MKKLAQLARKLLVGLVTCTGLYLVVALILSLSKCHSTLTPISTTHDCRDINAQSGRRLMEQ
jgi:hypothetical protein